MVENVHHQGSHRHFCGIAGHDWQCSDNCECICGLPMNGNDHSECPVELRECPEHEFQQGQQMPEEAPEALRNSRKLHWPVWQSVTRRRGRGGNDANW
jgi:hypothetical protein